MSNTHSCVPLSKPLFADNISVFGSHCPIVEQTPVSPAVCAENRAENVCEMCFSVLDLSNTHRLT